jgi:hypothetical protein
MLAERLHAKIARDFDRADQMRQVTLTVPLLTLALTLTLTHS